MFTWWADAEVDDDGKQAASVDVAQSSLAPSFHPGAFLDWLAIRQCAAQYKVTPR